MNPNTTQGWKMNNFYNPRNISNAACGDIVEEDFASCILQKTFSKQETIFKFSHAGQGKIVNASEHFNSDVSYTPPGQCHTLKGNAKILTFGDSFQRGFLSFTLNSTLDYIIMLHDSRYFYLSLDSEAIPGVRLKIQSSNTSRTEIYNLKMIKHIHRNTAVRPCNNEADYNFTRCLRGKVESQGNSSFWPNSNVTCLFNTTVTNTFLECSPNAPNSRWAARCLGTLTEN